MEFRNAAERRAWLLARVEEVERRRNADSKNNRATRRFHRAKVREYVEANPGSTICQIAAALGLTEEQVWETGLQRKHEFYQTGNKRRAGFHQIRWWPTSVSAKKDQVV